MLGRILCAIAVFVLCLALVPVAAAAGPAAVAYTALGDSYSAGEGNPPFDGDCHRTLRADSAYARMLPGLVGYLSPPNFHACTGAVVADVWRRHQPDRDGQLVQTHYVHPSDRLVTLTIGGNDLHFAEIVKSCYLSSDCSGTPLARQIEEELPAIQSKLTTAYEQVRSRMDPGGYLVLAGYPHLFSLGPGADCGLFVSPHEAAWVDGLVDRGDARIAAAVRAARLASGNVFYVDVTRAFAGHERCTDEPWLNGLTFSLAEGVQGSYHPNRGGQRAYATAIAAFLRRPAIRSALLAP